MLSLFSQEEPVLNLNDKLVCMHEQYTCDVFKLIMENATIWCCIFT